MAWLEFTVDTVPDGIGRVSDRLTAGGFSDLVIEDAGEYTQFLEENRAYWDYIDESLEKSLQGLSRIRLYLENTDQAGRARLEGLLETLRGDPSLGSLALHTKPLPDTDWEESWKDSYPPQPVGERLVILPYWHTDAGNRLPVILNPGLTFGTGFHPSTQMVLENMERHLKPGDRCLDLGSGSGILSIAALRLGAESAVGVDIDPKAETAARENAGYNGYDAPEFTALTGNVTQDRRLMETLRQRTYDLVFVNIVADVIISLSPVLPDYMEADTLLICSGILENRLADVTAALEKAGLTVVSVSEKEDWRCVCAKRQGVLL